MRGFFVLVLLIVGFLYFCGVLAIEGGFGVYLKRSPGFDNFYVDVGDPPYSLEPLMIMTNQRFSYLLLSYHERRGLRAFRSLPALP